MVQYGLINKTGKKSNVTEDSKTSRGSKNTGEQAALTD